MLSSPTLSCIQWFNNRLILSGNYNRHFFPFQNDKILAKIKTYQLSIKTEINNTLISDMNEAKFMENFSMGLLVSVVILSTIIILLVNQTTNTIQSYSTVLVERTNQLLLERTKSDRLLGQMLPLPVIQQLKQQRQVWIKECNIETEAWFRWFVLAFCQFSVIFFLPNFSFRVFRCVVLKVLIAAFYYTIRRAFRM